MSANPNSGSAPTMDPLPLEILFTILDIAFQSNSLHSGRLRFLLLSRAVYRWVLPRFYHTLDLDVQNNHAPPSHSVDRVMLLARAPPSSFLFTRRIISRMSNTPFDFALFSQLTHLSLWGRNYLDVDPHGLRAAHEILSLPLGELFVWDEIDNNFLIRGLTIDVTIYRTLQRYGCHSRNSHDRPDKGWLKCPNLVQVLILFADMNWFMEIAASGVTLPSSPKFRSWVISPFASIGSPPLQYQNALGRVAKDRRIVVLRYHPPHLFQYPQSFWENQSDMWKIALREVEKNENVKQMTVIEKLPWAIEKGFYDDLSKGTGGHSIST
ncbi:hypothetical protein DL96DRAFT_1626978 [Flagelloscypha sp. PMI_526]|nr:hypothetical protein DL96DRAFT_1626978 [Flagelloscypha sp. PMI_526]